MASSASSVVASSTAASAAAKLAAARTAAKASALYARIALDEYEALREAYTITHNQHRTLQREYATLQKEYVFRTPFEIRDCVARHANVTAAHIASSTAMIARQQAKQAVVEARAQKTLFEEEALRKAYIASLPPLRPLCTTVDKHSPF